LRPWSFGNGSSSVKVVKVVPPYRPAYRVELAVDHLVAPDLVQPVKGADELADEAVCHAPA
jgi:hypothetical protein